MGIYRKMGFYPLLGIQVVLVVVYFTAMSLYGRTARGLVLEKVQAQMQSIAQAKSAGIEKTTSKVYSATELFQKEYARLFANPDSFPKPAAIPTFKKAPNGVTYKPVDNGGSYVWYSNITQQGAEQQRKRLFTEAIDPTAKNIKNSDPSIVAVYMNTHDSMCRYYPYVKDVWKWAGYQPNMRIPEFNFYYLADAKHNPDKKPVWTRAYLDPAGQGWMVSCIAPIYRGDFLEGVAGLDITIEQMVKLLFSEVLPYGSQAMLVDDSGTILAMPTQVARWLGLKEMTGHRYLNPVTNTMYKPDEYNLLNASHGDIAQAFRPIITGQADVGEVMLNGKPFVLAASTIKGSGWQIVTLVDRDVVYQPVMELQYQVNGLGATALIVAIILTVLVWGLLDDRSNKLAQRISLPIEQLVSASTAIAKGIGLPRVEASGISEVDLLSNNFARMAKVLKADALRKQHYTSRLKTVHELTNDPELDFDQKQRQLLQMIQREMELVSVTLVQQQATGLEAVCSAGEVTWPDCCRVAIDGMTRTESTEVIAGQMSCPDEPAMTAVPVLWIPYMVDGMVTGGVACRFAAEQDDAEASDMELLQMVAQWYGFERERHDSEIRRKTLMTDLQAVNKELSEFAYVASHDMKAPLRSISSLADWLMNDYSEKVDEQGREIMELLVSRVRRMNALVEGVLNYARIGKSHDRTEMLDIEAIVRGLFEGLNSEHRHHLEIIGKLPEFVASKSYFEQLFLNLLGNAVKYMDKEHGVVTVTCEEAGGMYEFAISDNGPGISDQHHEEVFSILQTMKLRGNNDSTGIGLAHVKKIVDLYGGSIWLQSGEGKGATFRFRIPTNPVAQLSEKEDDAALQDTTRPPA